MGDLVPYNWDWEREYEEIRRELTRRWQYRLKGRPCPTELANAEELIQTLERMKPILKSRINNELEEQATRAMQAVAATYTATITNPEEKTTSSSGRFESADMPQTESEKLLEQVEIVVHWAQKDAREQRSQRFELTHSVHCGIDCPYSDQCRLDPGGQRRIPNSTYYGHCLLHQLSLVAEASGWKKLLGQHYARLENPFLLRRIRSSFYYQPTHEDWLYCISKPSGCPYTQGRKCLIRLIEEEWERTGQ